MYLISNDAHYNKKVFYLSDGYIICKKCYIEWIVQWWGYELAYYCDVGCIECYVTTLKVQLFNEYGIGEI